MISLEAFKRAALRQARETALPPQPMTRVELIQLSQHKPILPENATDRDRAIKDILTKARTRREPITRGEMFGFVNGIVAGQVTTEQTTAWLKSVHKNGLSPRETVDLTLAMAASGDVLTFDDLGNVADKHSSGGVGDKTTLVVGPLVAACDVKVGKMSGKGLGHTGGTIDKLESIPGLTTELSSAQFRTQLETTGIVVAGQSHDLAPADGILYALRGQTETIDSIPLIAASIMSKKIASGANTLVLDVKVGKGAFMKTVAEAEVLARTMVDIGKSIGIKCVAEISDMNQPLGDAVGNALEVAEAIATLKGGGPQDFREHCIETAAEIVMLAGKAETHEQAIELVTAQLGEGGKALQKFGEMIAAQGGDPKVLVHPEKILPQARFQYDIAADQVGYISGIDPELIGKISMKLGAGRPSKDAPVEDPAAGILVARQVGNRVSPGDALFTVCANDETKLMEAVTALQEAISYSRRRVSPLPPRYSVVR